ncbi:MAG: glutathione S-transferase family protein [Pseudomonadota bacterium]|nr:glutathione S-transferase family protein [Pseudomonadota bacterium]
MYILYGGGVSRSVGPQMVLEEAGLPYELRHVDIAAGDHRTAEFLAVNPAGYVPALVTPEGETLHEAAAIMLYLADRHQLHDMAPPPDDPLRGRFYSRLFFHTSDIQPAHKRSNYPQRYTLDPADTERVRNAARAMARERWAVLDGFLAADGPYHLGERFSLLDLHMAVWVNYGLGAARDLADEFPAVGACFARVMARPKAAALLDDVIAQVANWRAPTQANRR